MTKLINGFTRIHGDKPWTPLDLAFVSGGSNRELGDMPLPHDVFIAKQAISAKMGYEFNPEDAEILKAFCHIDGLPVVGPTLSISRHEPIIPTVPGGRFLVVSTVCVYGAATPTVGLGIYECNLFYIPNTVNHGEAYYPHCSEAKIQSTGWCTSGDVRQKYYIRHLQLARDILIGKSSEMLKAIFTAVVVTVPAKIID